MQMSGQLHAPPALPTEKAHHYPMNPSQVGSKADMNTGGNRTTSPQLSKQQHDEMCENIKVQFLKKKKLWFHMTIERIFKYNDWCDACGPYIQLQGQNTG